MPLLSKLQEKVKKTSRVTKVSLKKHFLCNRKKMSFTLKISWFIIFTKKCFLICIIINFNIHLDIIHSLINRFNPLKLYYYGYVFYPPPPVFVAYHKKTSLKKIFFIVFALFSFAVFSQNRQDYYVVAKSGFSLMPLQQTTNQDETLTLDFENNNFESYINSKPVYYFQKAFPTASTPYLQRVFKITLNNETYLQELIERDEIENVYLTGNGEPLYIPNDFQFISNRASSSMELINSSLAWNITQGDSNIIIGIVDTYFETDHEDLTNQILQNFDNNPSGNPHGTLVAGMAAAQTDNNLGISSIGFNSKLITMANGSNMTQVLLLSQIPGVKVINMSWKTPGCNSNPVDAMVCEEIWTGSGGFPPVVLIAAGGNGPNGGNSCGTDGNGYLYPAAYKHTIAVGAISHLFPIGTNDTDLGESNWKDVIPNIIDNSTTTSSLNDKIDIFAPGFYLYCTALNNSYQLRAVNSAEYGAGTSLASPIVAGTVALMFAVNPSLTPDDVREILLNTAENISLIPQNSPYIGYLSPNTGRLNAYRAVLIAKCMANPTQGLDLAIQNSNLDTFAEPDITTEYLWRSEDIWVRNQDDGKLIDVHQNPEYSPTQPNYVYVRVTNNSCETSTDTDLLKLYWAKANTSLSWPQHWDGSLFINDPITNQDILMGDEVGTLAIPSLSPGESKIIEFEWVVPNPEDYENINVNPWHFCLLSRIVSVDDPMTYLEGTAINQNVKNNNNIAWKNTTVVDLLPNTPSPIGGVIAVGNPTSLTNTYSLEFIKETSETGKPIYDEAEITIEMDDVLYNAWVRGGKSGQNFDSTKTAYKKIVTGNNTVLSNIIFNPNEMGTLNLTFNFLTKEITEKSEFIYHVVQRDNTNEIIGGETYEIRKKPRPSFDADAGNDAEINKNENVTITAAQINEAAIYNWYDPEGNLIYTGANLTVSPNVTQTYKLEIISDIDGYKDYDEVEVTVNPYQIESLVPNPASNFVNVNYTADEAISAYIMIVDTNSGTSNNYILDITEFTTIIDISNYPSGLYSVALVCEGTIVDSSLLIKQ